MRKYWKDWLSRHDARGNAGYWEGLRCYDCETDLNLKNGCRRPVRTGTVFASLQFVCRGCLVGSFD